MSSLYEIVVNAACDGGPESDAWKYIHESQQGVRAILQDRVKERCQELAIRLVDEFGKPCFERPIGFDARDIDPETLVKKLEAAETRVASMRKAHKDAIGIAVADWRIIAEGAMADREKGIAETRQWKERALEAESMLDRERNKWQAELSALELKLGAPNPVVETQLSINDWQREKFGTDAQPIATATRIVEEAVELLQALIKGASVEAVADEVADQFIFGCYLGLTMGFDVQEAIDRKMVKNRARKWAPSGAGHYQHVEETAGAIYSQMIIGPTGQCRRCPNPATSLGGMCDPCERIGGELGAGEG